MTEGAATAAMPSTAPAAPLFEGGQVVAVALGYVFLLFLLAWVGDRYFRARSDARGRPLIYALSLGVFCTSWTFFGSVGLAVRTGYDFLPVYLGPVLMFAVGWPLVMRVMRLAKSQNITSVADFLASRYGKSEAVAAVVTVLAVFGILPYISLQLKAIAVSIETMLGGTPLVSTELPSIGFVDTASVITLALAAFAILFGTRHVDATEHQDGLMLAIAAESLIKLAAFIGVGLLVVFSVYDGPSDLLTQWTLSPTVTKTFASGFNGSTWLTVTFLSFTAVLLLPRQFHVAIVENYSETEVRRAAWMFPLYLVLINLLVIPIAAAGMLRLPASLADPDFYVLTLPMSAGSTTMTLAAFIGGLSSATAMVIVETIALAIMICNGLVVPMLLRRSSARAIAPQNMAGTLLMIRRVAILAILVLAYAVFRAFGKSQGLAQLGLIAFAATAQLAPAFFGGLMWRRATARGAIMGMLIGFAIWLYTLVLPWAAEAGWVPAAVLQDGPLGLSFLRPQALLYMQLEPLTHGVVWSVGANLATYVFVSLLREPAPIERLQAHIFIAEEGSGPQQPTTLRNLRTAISMGDLVGTAARYMGSERAERSFAEYATTRSLPMHPMAEADLHAIRFTERLLASAIGAASSRLVLSLLLKRGNVSGQTALKLLDDASEALQYNRDLLQSALDQVRHGLCVYDKDMRLVCWNRQYRELLDLPPEMGRVGVQLDRVLRYCAERGDYGIGATDELVASRLMKLAVTKETHQERTAGGTRILEIRTSPMPQGGIVTTYSDITDRVAAATALARANETLERRVRERTAELLEANTALAVAKSKADEANLDKTRFLAAASHDILQPLNAARLYATSLTERALPATEAKLADNVDAALSSVEEIFSALIEISRMDSGRLEAEIRDFPLDDIFKQMQVEFEPLAHAKGLALRIEPTTQWVRSDRRLLRRVLQNLLANAIKYTRSGTVLLGVRRQGAGLSLQVLDTGPGIPQDKQQLIFKEFQRLEGPGSNVRGVGLGLSIVERIGKLLDHRITLRSTAGRGSSFAISVPRAEPRVLPRAETGPGQQTGNLAGITVLCIDNERAVLAGMEALLTGWGCKVATAPSKLRAEALITSSFSPDVVLADYHLDSGTGVDAVLAVRAALQREVPAVIITADHTAEVQRLVRGHGFAILRKPLKAAALRALMAQYAPRRASAAE